MAAIIKPVQFHYTNHRGNRELRTVTVDAVELNIRGVPEYNYPPNSWVLSGFCHDRKQRRSFLLKNIDTSEANSRLGNTYSLPIRAQEVKDGQS